MTEQQINTALRQFLYEPFTDELRAAYESCLHFDDDKLTALQAEAEAVAIVRRHRFLPCNFTESLDACRLVEERLPDDRRLRYAARLMGRNGGGWQGLAFVSALDRARTLVEVLGLVADK